MNAYRDKCRWPAVPTYTAFADANSHFLQRLREIMIELEDFADSEIRVPWRNRRKIRPESLASLAQRVRPNLCRPHPNCAKHVRRTFGPYGCDQLVI